MGSDAPSLPVRLRLEDNGRIARREEAATLFYRYNLSATTWRALSTQLPALCSSTRRWNSCLFRNFATFMSSCVLLNYLRFSVHFYGDKTGERVTTRCSKL